MAVGFRSSACGRASSPPAGSGTLSPAACLRRFRQSRVRGLTASACVVERRRPAGWQLAAGGAGLAEVVEALLGAGACLVDTPAVPHAPHLGHILRVSLNVAALDGLARAAAVRLEAAGQHTLCVCDKRWIADPLAFDRGFDEGLAIGREYGVREGGSAVAEERDPAMLHAQAELAPAGRAMQVCAHGSSGGRQAASLDHRLLMLVSACGNHAEDLGAFAQHALRLRVRGHRCDRQWHDAPAKHTRPHRIARLRKLGVHVNGWLPTHARVPDVGLGVVNAASDDRQAVGGAEFTVRALAQARGQVVEVEGLKA
eukprot:scaffold9556_cov64-Phaeocystis_antarctica.AAC.5